MFINLFANSLNSRLFGRKQELRAQTYLKRHGMRPIARNFSWPGGELDLVMLDSNHTLVFIEVRFRSNSSYGSALHSVTPGKQSRVRNSAARFLQLNPGLGGYPCRFDVVGISPGKLCHSPNFCWIKDAFR